MLALNGTRVREYDGQTDIIVDVKVDSYSYDRKRVAELAALLEQTVEDFVQALRESPAGT